MHGPSLGVDCSVGSLVHLWGTRVTLETVGLLTGISICCISLSLFVCQFSTKVKHR